MFQCLWVRSDISRLWYVQHDRRWGFSIHRQVIDDKVEVIGLPIGFPYERFSLIRKVNRLIQAKHIARSIPLDDAEPRFVYWFYDWLNIELIRNLPYATTVMELTDSAEQFHAATGSTCERLPGIKRVVRERASVVFAVNPALSEELRPGNCRVEVLSNGISSEFLDFAETPAREPVQLRNLARPRLLVVGTTWSLSHRVDHKLLSDALVLLHDWELIIIGCTKIESEGLKKLARSPRVHLFGMQSQTNLVPFIQHVDVCAVPYVKGAQLRDTLKTYEYLACGKPTVLTSDAVTLSLQRYVRYAHDADAFAGACRELLAVPPERQDCVRRLLRTMTWEQRAERALQLIRDPIDSRTTVVNNV